MSEPTISPAADEGAALRARLVAMRAELIEWLVRDETDAGVLSLMAGIGATLEALDAMPADTAARAIVSDDVMLAPCRAFALAGEMIAALPPRPGA